MLEAAVAAIPCRSEDLLSTVARTMPQQRSIGRSESRLEHSDDAGSALAKGVRASRVREVWGDRFVTRGSVLSRNYALLRKERHGHLPARKQLAARLWLRLGLAARLEHERPGLRLQLAARPLSVVCEVRPAPPSHLRRMRPRVIERPPNRNTPWSSAVYMHIKCLVQYRPWPFPWPTRCGSLHILCWKVHGKYKDLRLLRAS